MRSPATISAPRGAAVALVVACASCFPGEAPKDTGQPEIPTDPEPPTVPTGTPPPVTTPPETTPPAECDLTPPPPYTVPADPTCASDPVLGTFDPVVEWTWTENPVNPGYHQVAVAPVVIQLTDDDLDGAIDADDTPDIVFVAFEGSNYSAGALTAISGADGATLWSVLEAGGAHPRGIGGIAAGDLDGDGWPEIVIPSLEGLLCVDAAGAFRWLAQGTIASAAMPAIGDLEGDGLAEVVVGRSVFEHDGAARWTGTAGQGGEINVASFPADLDGDGLLEVVAGNTVYEHDGQVRWTDGLRDGKPAIADFDGDGAPEVLRVTGGLVYLVDGDDGALRWTFPLVETGQGAATIADFDGDGLPEVGVASVAYYRVLDGDGTELWAMPTEDASSGSTGASAFDFEGDGTLELVYADEHTLWVFDGATGAVELQWAHGSGTGHEYPPIVDLDHDGSAEIVVVSNDYAWGYSTGVTVIGDRASSWGPARQVWNQHAYFVTNVEDDGGIPLVQAQSWLGSNTFRAANQEPRVGPPAVDLAVGQAGTCLVECAEDRAYAWFPVDNAGAADAADVTLSLTRLDALGASSLGSFALPLVAAGSAAWVGPVELTPEDFGSDGLSAVVSSPADDCDPQDDTLLWEAFPCPP